MEQRSLPEATRADTPHFPSTLMCPNGHPVQTLETLCPQCGTLTQAEPLPPGSDLPVVPGYEILSVLGRGGMGVIYKAKQLSLDRVVALKMIRDGGLAGVEERDRFRAEAQAIARLQHPHVVQVFEVGEHHGQPFFSLELVSGGSLAEKLRGTPQLPDQAVRIVETLAHAVHAAHQQGVVHRDLKPANVLLTLEGTPKVGDFGLAKRLDSSIQTRSGAILGTPAYMAPEQAAGASKALGPPCDIYALGAILYEMLTGRPPFLGQTALDTLEQVKNQEPVPPRQLQPRVPRDLETICLKCLQKEPKKRYASAEDLAEDLRRFAAGQPIRARRAGPVERLAVWCRRRPAVTVLALLLILVFVVGFSGVLWKWREAEHHRQQAEQAEERALAQAGEAERHRQLAEQAEDRARTQARAAVEALTYVSASAIADTFAPLSPESKTLLARVGKKPQAIRTLKRACELGEQLLKDNTDPRLLLALIEQYAQLGVFQAAAGQRDAAITTCRRGLELLERLESSSRDDLGDPKELALSCFLLGAALMNLDQPDDAARAFQRAVQHQRAVFERDTTDPARRKTLSSYLFHLAHVQRQAGRVDESADTSRERQKLWPKDAEEVYDVACELARCAGRIAAGKKDSELTPQELRERRQFADRAMIVLRQAVNLGLKDAAAVRNDPDMKPLQTRDDFRKLMTEMEGRERRR